MRRAFRSNRAYAWMDEARCQLTDRGHYDVAEYMWALTETVADARLMVSRLRNEKRAWAATDQRIQIQVAQADIGPLQATMAGYRNAVVTEGLTAQTDTFLQAYLDQGRLWLNTATELHRLVGFECPYIQFLILGFLKQDATTQRVLRTGYMDTLAWRLQSVLVRVVEDMAAAVTMVHDEWVVERNARFPQNLDLVLAGAADFDQAVFAAREKLHTTHAVLVDMHELLTTCTSHPELAPGIAQDRFQMLAAAAGLHQLKTSGKGNYLEKLARRDMEDMVVDDPVRLLVGVWLNLLARVKGMEEATREQRAAIRLDVHERFGVPPALGTPGVRLRPRARTRRRGFTVAGFRTRAAGPQPSGRPRVSNAWVSGGPRPAGGPFQLPLRPAAP